MSSYTDKLEENLRQKIDVLEKAYESDVRFENTFDVNNGTLEQYDEYLIEQDSYISTLEDLDVEYDRLYEYLASHRAELETADRETRNRLNSLINEVDGKLQAVREAESKVKAITDTYFKTSRSRIAVSRKNTRVIQSNYGTVPSLVAADNSMFDTTN